MSALTAGGRSIRLTTRNHGPSKRRSGVDYSVVLLRCPCNYTVLVFRFLQHASAPIHHFRYCCDYDNCDPVLLLNIP